MCCTRYYARVGDVARSTSDAVTLLIRPGGPLIFARTTLDAAVVTHPFSRRELTSTALDTPVFIHASNR